MKGPALPGRQELVHQVRDRLLRESAPRLQLVLIVGLAGLAAFLSSIATLRLGVPWMAVRYPLAVACGYLIFFVLIRWWIAWQRRFDEATLVRSSGDGVDLIDIGDFARVRFPSSGASEMPLFAAGRGGGAGASTQWAAASSGSAPQRAAEGGSFDFDLDLDEMWWVVIAAACVLGAAAAIGYVIYAAPLLLAEVALDAAIVSTLYRRLRQDDVSHWAVTVLKRTWMSAAALMVFAALGGYAMQQIAPEARSIGGVIRELRRSADSP
jgi:hypothetical protein